MTSCSLLIVHASLKNMVSRKTRLKFLVPESGGRTWRDKKMHDFHNFSNSGLKFYMRISECICNRIMMKKKYPFFDPFTGEAPLKTFVRYWFLSILPSGIFLQLSLSICTIFTSLYIYVNYWTNKNTVINNHFVLQHMNLGQNFDDSPVETSLEALNIKIEDMEFGWT